MSATVVLSRAGEASLLPEHRDTLQRDGGVRFHQRRTAPGQVEAARLLLGARVLASTNVTLPQLDPWLLDRLPLLRHVVLYATGYDHVDLAELDARGITLSTLPDYATNAVAEHALGLIFASATRVHLANDRARGLVGTEVSLRGIELTGKTLAIVGVGRIGTRLAALARGIGLRVIGVDTDPCAAERATRAGIGMRSLADALPLADLVGVCASTIPGTSPIIGARELAQLRPGAFLVNVARPLLVDNLATRDALVTGRLRGYAVDEIVFDPRHRLDARLMGEGRLVQTSHSAWWRDEVLERGQRLFGAAVCAAADGSPINVVATAPDELRRAG